MTRSGWRAVAGLGVAGLLVAAPPAPAEERTQTSASRTTASDTNKSGKKTTTEPGTTATDTNKTGRTSTDETSAARGSGMGGTSTGARPGEVTGTAPTASSTGTAQTKNQVTGRIEKFDRGTRTLSLANSDKKLKLTDDTEVTKDGQKVSPGQIMEGDEVRASFSGSGDTLRVDRLEVMTPAGTGGAASGAGTSGTPPSTGTGTSSESGRSSSGAPGGTKP